MFSRVAYALTKVSPVCIASVGSNCSTEVDTGEVSVFTPSRNPECSCGYHTYPWNFSPTAKENKYVAPEFDIPPDLSLKAIKLRGQS